VARITLVATGGARAPTQVDLADRFRSDGHEVRCLATRNALLFLTSHIARRPRRLAGYARLYRTHLRERLAYFDERPGHVPHISEAAWPDVVVVAPATCNSIGKLVAGITDSFPMLVVRAVPRSRKVIVVPSMNPEMWFDPGFQRSLDLLNATEKYRVLCPTHGEMLSGDFGFGAQVAFEDIVAETYRALGLVDPRTEQALTARSYAPPWREPGGDGAGRCVVLVDEDREVLRDVATALARAYPEAQVEQFGHAGAALEWIKEHPVSVLVTALSSTSGASGYDLIDHVRRPGAVDRVEVIATSDRDRRAVSAERLAREDVLFQPKPLNVPFLVGMVGGCLRSAGHRGAGVVRRPLQAGEVLFREGDSSDHIYVVDSGRLRVEGERGGRLGTIEAGGIVGEMAFLGDGVRSATVLAEVESDVIEIDLDDVRGYLQDQPGWLQALIRSLSGHLRSANARLLEATPDPPSDGVPGE
jgi:DNA-binding response OmpR family regulator/3-polyprenyl-4-hydroxybenzoate decarboxylase